MTVLLAPGSALLLLDTLLQTFLTEAGVGGWGAQVRPPRPCGPRQPLSLLREGEHGRVVEISPRASDTCSSQPTRRSSFSKWTMVTERHPSGPRCE